MAISEVRNVLTDHLFLTMNCLSLTGEFHGLNAKGIKQLRQQMSISSVFMEGCFSVSFYVLHGVLFFCACFCFCVVL